MARCWAAAIFLVQMALATTLRFGICRARQRNLLRVMSPARCCRGSERMRRATGRVSTPWYTRNLRWALLWPARSGKAGHSPLVKSVRGESSGRHMQHRTVRSCAERLRSSCREAAGPTCMHLHAESVGAVRSRTVCQVSGWPGARASGAEASELFSGREESLLGQR